MSKRLYIITRDRHLYIGLFLSPFVLVFSISVFFLTHAWISGGTGQPVFHRVMQDVALPANIDQLSGRARIDALQPVLAKIGVAGEVSFVRHNVKERRLIIPVFVPGRETTVEIDMASHSAFISQRDTGIADALVALHKLPGPHLADIRMNWLPIRAWGWIADGTVYLLFFISGSGVYLWAVLRSERRIGIVLIVAGAVSFLGVIYAAIH